MSDPGYAANPVDIDDLAARVEAVERAIEALPSAIARALALAVERRRVLVGESGPELVTMPTPEED